MLLIFTCAVVIKWIQMIAEIEIKKSDSQILLPDNPKFML